MYKNLNLTNQLFYLKVQTLVKLIELFVPLALLESGEINLVKMLTLYSSVSVRDAKPMNNESTY